MKISYLFGAGASIGAIPAVKKNKEGINILDDMLSLPVGEIFNIAALNKKQNQIIKLCDLIKKYAEEAKPYGTPDTLAKAFYETKKNDKVIELKQALVSYLIIKEFYQNKREKRYLGFISSILHENKFPEHVKFFSWNYDYQFQLAAHEIIKDSSIDFRFFPNKWSSNDAKVPKDLNLIHLNGLAIAHYNNRDGYTKTKFEYPTLSVSRDLDWLKFLEIIFYPGEDTQNLTFAWEKNDPVNKVRNQILEEYLTGTTILVVIGYSFPFFNRTTDNKIFELLKPKLQKVYFQDPYNDGQFLTERYNLQIPIIHIKETDSFHIPYEL